MLQTHGYTGTYIAIQNTFTRIWHALTYFYIHLHKCVTIDLHDNSLVHTHVHIQNPHTFKHLYTPLQPYIYTYVHIHPPQSNTSMQTPQAYMYTPLSTHSHTQTHLYTHLLSIYSQTYLQTHMFIYIHWHIHL